MSVDSYNQTLSLEVTEPLRAGIGGDERAKVLILNPSDSQGNQVADYRGIYPTLRGCGGAGYQQGYVLAPKGQDEAEDIDGEEVL